MKNGIIELFPSLIYKAPLGPTAKKLNRELLSEVYKIKDYDKAGQSWSKKNYPKGYTSYSSLSKLYEVSSTFAELKKQITRHVRKYTKAQHWEIDPSELKMTSLWINYVPKGGFHSSHIHPLSIVSGTYYLQVPKSGCEIKFEDPRLTKFMASPMRSPKAPAEFQPFVSLKPKAGEVVFFESWMRHEVVQNLSSTPRISISFNFER